MKVWWCDEHHGHVSFQDSADGLVPNEHCVVWELWWLRKINMSAVRPCRIVEMYLLPVNVVGEVWMESTGAHSLSGWWTDHPLSEGPFYLIPKAIDE